MKLTYKQMLDGNQFLGELLQLKPAPTARLAAQIARNARLIEAALKDFTVARDVLLQPHMQDGAFNEDALEPDVRATLHAEYEELIATEVEVDVHPLRLTDIEAVEKAKPGFEIPTITYYAIGWMFDMEA